MSTWTLRESRERALQGDAAASRDLLERPSDYQARVSSDLLPEPAVEARTRRGAAVNLVHAVRPSQSSLADSAGDDASRQQGNPDVVISFLSCHLFYHFRYKFRYK